MPDWISKYWIEWIFGILCAILAGLYRNLASRMKKQKAESDAVKNGMRALLKRQLVEDCEAATAEGFCPVTKKDLITDMYQCYHALGGNDTVTQLKDAVMNLPTVRPEKHDHVNG